MQYKLVRANRKTLGMAIERDGSIVIRAPMDCPQNAIDEFFSDKRFWIYKKLAEKRLIEPALPKREYVNGEGFLYLGRSYKLVLVDDKAPLRLHNGVFKMNKQYAVVGRETFIDWYRTHAQDIITERVNRYKDRFIVQPKSVKVMDLKYRWGSCSNLKNLNFHWKIILAPLTVVDYVVVHEMVHLIEKNHTPAFWEMVRTILPDYEARKEWLDRAGKDLDI